MGFRVLLRYARNTSKSPMLSSLAITMRAPTHITAALAHTSNTSTERSSELDRRAARAPSDRLRSFCFSKVWAKRFLKPNACTILIAPNDSPAAAAMPLTFALLTGGILDAATVAHAEQPKDGSTAQASKASLAFIHTIMPNMPTMTSMLAANGKCRRHHNIGQLVDIAANAHD